jgi:hypothetical protein
MRSIYLLFVFLAFAIGAPEGGGRVEYVGGTRADLRIGSDGTLVTSHADSLWLLLGGRGIEVPYRKVNLLEYGQKVDRRYLAAIVISPLLLLSKSRKHFLTVGYADELGAQQAMVFRLDKKHVRAVLASLEARTGLRVEYQDDEARKAGKG